MRLSAVVQIFYAMAFLNSSCRPGWPATRFGYGSLRRNPHGIATAVNSVLIDRLVVVLALLLAAAAVQPFLWLQAATPILTLTIVGSALSLIAAIGVVVFVVPRINWPILGRLLPMLHAVSRDLRQVFLGLAGLSRAIVAALASNLLLVGAGFALAYGAGIDVGFRHLAGRDVGRAADRPFPSRSAGGAPERSQWFYMLGLFAVPRTWPPPSRSSSGCA